MIELKDGDTVKLGNTRYKVLAGALVEAPKGIGGDLFEFADLAIGQEFYLKLEKVQPNKAIYKSILGSNGFTIPDHAWCEINVPKIKNPEVKPVRELNLNPGDVISVQMKVHSKDAYNSILAHICHDGDPYTLSAAVVPDSGFAHVVRRDSENSL